MYTSASFDICLISQVFQGYFVLSSVLEKTHFLDG